MRGSESERRPLRPVGVVKSVIRVIGSPEATTAILGALFVLVLASTFFQIGHSLQETTSRFFAAWWLWAGPVPLPSGRALFLVALVNLVAATATRIPRRPASVGMYLIHAGLAILVAGGLVTGGARRESVIALAEGESTAYSYDPLRWDLVVAGEREIRHPVERIPARIAGRETTVLEYLPDAVVDAAGPDNVRHVGGGASIRRPDGRRPTPIPGLLLSIDGRTVLVHGSDPSAFDVAPGLAIRLLPRIYPLPAEVRLERFLAEFHDDTRVPRSFTSVIEIVEGEVTRRVTLAMNLPARFGQLSIYQSGYDPGDGTGPRSILQVVSNPYRRLPAAAGAVVVLGLIAHLVAGHPRSRRGDHR